MIAQRRGNGAGGPEGDSPPAQEQRHEGHDQWRLPDSTGTSIASELYGSLDEAPAGAQRDGDGGGGCSHPIESAGGPRGHDRADEGGDPGPQGRATSEEDDLRGARCDECDEFLDGEHPVSDEDTVQGCMSASERLSRKLSLGRARQMEQLSCSVVPKIFEGLVSHDRRILLEVACEHNSLLTASVQSAAGRTTAASRCLLQDKCDLATPEGVELVVNRIKMERPRHVWISPPSSAYSPYQSLNQKTPEQQQELREQRKQALRLYQGAAVVVYTCQQLGIHCSWEWSEGCNGWRLPLIQRLLQRGGLQTTIVKGCRVNLRDPNTGQLVKSGWKIATTCARMAEMLNLPCRCDSTYTHAKLSGKHTSLLRRYTPELSKRIASVMMQEMNQHTLAEELRGASNLCEGFGDGLCCRCEDVSTPEHPVQCQACVQGDDPTRETQATEPKVNQVGMTSTLAHGDEASGMNQGEDGEEVSLEEFEAFMSDTETQDVEAQAQQLLQEKDYRQDKCTELLKKLPFKPVRKHRGMLGDSRAVYVLLGGVCFRKSLWPVFPYQ